MCSFESWANDQANIKLNRHPDNRGARLTAISATVCDSLYGVDRAGKICQLVREGLAMRRPPPAAQRLRSWPRVKSHCDDEDEEEGGWAVVE